MIRMENIEKFYPQGVQKYFVLRRISLEIREGEFVSIMGPSGAGKSTLLHIMGMHDSGWSGEFYFIEQPIHKMSTKQRAETRNKNIGFVFQSYHLLDHHWSGHSDCQRTSLFYMRPLHPLYHNPQCSAHNSLPW